MSRRLMCRRHNKFRRRYLAAAADGGAAACRDYRPLPAGGRMPEERAEVDRSRVYMRGDQSSIKPQEAARSAGRMSAAGGRPASE